MWKIEHQILNKKKAKYHENPEVRILYKRCRYQEYPKSKIIYQKNGRRKIVRNK